MTFQSKKPRLDAEIAGYTNSSNPWGDSNLTEKFEWKKKREKELNMGLDPDELEKEREESRREELMVNQIELPNKYYLARN